MLELSVVEPGSAENAVPAVVTGRHVRIFVDCRENFGNPLPLALMIAASPLLFEALTELLAHSESMNSPSDEVWHSVRDLARYALSKAEGK